MSCNKNECDDTGCTTSKITMILIYNLLLLAGTAYIVFWKNQSGLWFILAVCLLMVCIPNKKTPFQISKLF